MNMSTDPGSENIPSSGEPLDMARFSNLIEFANQSAALEFLLTVKGTVRNTAAALTECTTPDVRMLVRKQLFQALDMHERVSDFMMKKGWFHPYNLGEQFGVDIESAKMTANIARLPLFKDRSKVLESFDTPN